MGRALVIKMYRVVSCLVTEHDTWLVLLAVVVLTALTSFLMYSIADLCSGRRTSAMELLTGLPNRTHSSSTSITL